LWWLLLTAVLLPLLFPPFYCWFLAPVALVPFCWCVVHQPLRMRALLAYYGLGVAFFLPNLFWLAPVTIGGLIALALYLAVYFPLFAWGLQRLVVQFRLPATIAVPLAWTAVEYFRATFVQGGFPWFVLGNCLAPSPLLIQGADLFGVWGLTFSIALLNGFFVDLLRLPSRRRREVNPAIGWLFAVSVGLVAFVVVYGVFRLNQETISPGPRVAVIQENIPQDVKEGGDPDDLFFKHVQLTKAAAAATPKPDLIVWPETMVPLWGNKEFLNAPTETFAKFDHPDFWPQARDRAKDYWQYLAALCDQEGIPLLLGTGSLEPRTNYDESIKQNRTVLLMPHAGVVEEYAKVHLVPFGEYLPFRSLPLVGKYMLVFSPNGSDYTLKPGDRWTRFPLTVGGRTYTFGTPICFEDTMPGPPRWMSFDGEKKTDFLVNVSNDGWFHSAELDQHLEADQLRAVENRIAIARSVNTGDSGFVDSDGRIMGLLTNPATGSSIGAVGTLAMTVPVDSRVSLFSRIGDLLPIGCGVVATLMVGWTYVRPRRGRGR
jgi:apolipoprotein N-acyltransferase